MIDAVDWKKRASEYRKLARTAKTSAERSKFRRLAAMHQLWAAKDVKRAASIPSAGPLFSQP